VSYLRTIASPQVKRRARFRCEYCQRWVFTFERYCPYCGGKNEAFDEQLFEQLALGTLSDNLEWCDKDIAHLEDRIAAVELNDPDLRYCAVCGRLFVTR
jgi:hypothetical protein